MHRDIKCENILFITEQDGQIILKLTDFGESCKVNENTNEIIGTDFYRANEIDCASKYGEKADCYSLGVVLHVLLTEDLPWKTKEEW